MKVLDYIRGKVPVLVYISLCFLLINTIVLISAPINVALGDILYMDVLLLAITLVYLLLDYRSWKKRYTSVVNYIKSKDESYELYKMGESYEEKLFRSLTQHHKEVYQRDMLGSKYKIDELTDYMVKWVHEIKIPLTVLELMSHELHGRHEQELKNEVSRLKYLVNQVLHMSRANSYSEDLSYQEIHIESLVKKVIRDYRTLLIQRDIQIELNNLNIEVLSDAKWLHYVLSQLLHNSVKYSDAGSSVFITAREENGLVTLIVEDKGCGIPHEDLERIWDKGFIGLNGRRNSGATGMGLYLVSKACHALGHELNVSSQEGKGTKVSITFNPLHDLYVTKMSS